MPSSRPQLRLLSLLLFILLANACGKEAPPRATTSTPSPEDAAARIQLDVTRLPISPDQTATIKQPENTDSISKQRTLGDPNAPITIIEYSDYQCPFCARFVHETKQLIEQNYIETGKVYFVYRDFPLTDIHPGALLAAHAANCAAQQDSFWPMHDRLFSGIANQEWGAGQREDFLMFLRYAQKLDLDIDKFETCVRTNEQSSLIQADYADAVKHGVRSTPSFLVNGELIVGAYPYSAWEEILDGLLEDQ